MKIEKEIKWAWIAGIIEGEGCFVWSKSGNQIQIQVNMTDEDTIRKLHEWSGVGIVNGPYQVEDNKPYWVWRVSRLRHVPIVINNVWPYMGKRRRARIVELQRMQLEQFIAKNSVIE